MLILLLIILLMVITFLIFFPFKFIVWNEKNYFYIKISKIITIKINLQILLDNNHNEEIKKQFKMIKLLNKIKIETINLKITGLNFDYEYTGVLYGYLHILLAILKNYLSLKNSEFNYDLKYIGEPSFNIKGIFYTNMGTIIKQSIGGKKNERTSN